MSLISLVGVVKDFGICIFFFVFDFYIGEGEWLGLIGFNGVGKFILLKVFVGKELFGEGECCCLFWFWVELVG